LNVDGLVVEIVRDRPGDSSAGIVLTDLWNRGMPFIRYELEDRVAASNRSCSCGRTYPLLERVMGRVADYLWTPSGGMVSGIALTETFAALAPEVEQVQIVQHHPDHLLVRFVPGPGFGEPGRARIAQLIRERFGPQMRHELEPVERIAPEASGKYRFTICKIPEGERPRAAVR
jgi:phenylacetate-CoA ligase